MILLLAGTIGLPGALTAVPAAPSVSVQARRIAPGEPLRVRVCGVRERARVRGTLLARDVAFDPGPAPCRTGWALVPLDAEPGLASIEVTEADGGEIRYASRAIRIEPGAFAVEHLEVQSAYVDPPATTRERIGRERSLLAEVYRKRGPRASGTDEPFVRPVPGPPTSVFGTRRVFNGKPRAPHPGLDLRAAEGTPVRGGAPGLVVVARDLYYAGNTVILDHGGGLFTLYAHLSTIDVHEGDTVRAGELVGRSGATGRVTGPHLHWGAKIGDEPFDPRALLDPALFD